MPAKSLWELLWDYDPNGLVAVDKEMKIRVVNPAFCRLFKTSPEQAIGKPASEILGDTSDFEDAGETVRVFEKEYPAVELYVRQVMLSIQGESITACIFVDITEDWKQRQEMQRLKLETAVEVSRVVDRQMRVAQEIAGLLGEATAETKGSLLKLKQMIEAGLV